MLMLIYIITLLFFSPIIFALSMIPNLLLKQEKQASRKKISVLLLAPLMISASFFVIGVMPPNNFAWIFLVITFVFGLLLATHATLTSNLYYHKPAERYRIKDNSIINGKILCAGVVFYIVALGIIQYLFLLLTGYNIDAGLDRSYDLAPPGAGESDGYRDFPLIQVIFSTIITVILTKIMVRYLRSRNFD